MPSLATALNQAYFGERVAFFGVVVGIALLLAGIGFVVLSVGGALRHRAAPAVAAEPGGRAAAETRELTTTH